MEKMEKPKQTIPGLNDQNLFEQLDKAADATNGAPTLFDLSGSALYNTEAKTLVRWMLQHPHVSMCVRGTTMGFQDVCKALLEVNGSVEWMGGRITFSDTENGRKLEAMHVRAYLEGRVLSMEEAFNYQQQIITANLAETTEALKRLTEAESREEFDRSMRESHKKLKDGWKNLDRWKEKQTDAFEMTATSVMRMYLGDVYELPRSRHNIPRMPPCLECGVEWDGVLWDESKQWLYLVEAKTSPQLDDITGMQKRMRRTREFISL
jgi:hypothetical protein